jgi:hypothetical protein
LACYVLDQGPRSVTSRHYPEHNAEIARIKTSRVNDANGPGMLELDSHADTTCVGADCRVIAYTE